MHCLCGLHGLHGLCWLHGLHRLCGLHGLHGLCWLHGLHRLCGLHRLHRLCSSTLWCETRGQRRCGSNDGVCRNREGGNGANGRRVLRLLVEKGQGGHGPRGMRRRLDLCRLEGVGLEERGLMLGVE